MTTRPVWKDRRMSASQTGLARYNGNAPAGAGNTTRRLTRSLDLTKEGLMPNSTRFLPGKNDPLILRAVAERPDWLERRIMGRLIDHGHPGPCWRWPGAVTTKPGGGYGIAQLPWSVTEGRGVVVVVHRVVWIATNGPIEPGMVLDHDGDNGCHLKTCANPAHLMLTTPAGNAATGYRARRTHCPAGHDLNDLGNQVPSATRGRLCLACNHERGQRRTRYIITAAHALGMTVARYKSTHGSSEATALRVIADASELAS